MADFHNDISDPPPTVPSRGPLVDGPHRNGDRGSGHECLAQGRFGQTPPPVSREYWVQCVVLRPILISTGVQPFHGSRHQYQLKGKSCPGGWNSPESTAPDPLPGPEEKGDLIQRQGVRGEGPEAAAQWQCLAEGFFLMSRIRRRQFDHFIPGWIMESFGTALWLTIVNCTSSMGIFRISRTPGSGAGAFRSSRTG